MEVIHSLAFQEVSPVDRTSLKHMPHLLCDSRSHLALVEIFLLLKCWAHAADQSEGSGFFHVSRSLPIGQGLTGQCHNSPELPEAVWTKDHETHYSLHMQPAFLVFSGPSTLMSCLGTHRSLYWSSRSGAIVPHPHCMVGGGVCPRLPDHGTWVSGLDTDPSQASGVCIELLGNQHPPATRS